MDPKILSLLCSPDTHRALGLARKDGKDGEKEEILVCEGSEKQYPIKEGIPVFIDPEKISGTNYRYQKLYNRMAPIYDLGMKLYTRLKSGGEEKRRMEYLRELEIKQGDKVLEVSIGTGGNLQYLPSHVEYFGLDISWGMLQQCRKNLKRWGREAELFNGVAEELPFREETFDVVFHMGGINFFNDIRQAISEMVRVAKAGTKILIVDENEKIAKKFENVPISGLFYKDRKEAISAPVDLLPPGMTEVKLQDLWDGELYCLTFRKP
jgi:ubiquinone/menaquinone biosynthesis C-methylase UbiE